jgi:hypothetical protein
VGKKARTTLLDVKRQESVATFFGFRSTVVLMKEQEIEKPETVVCKKRKSLSISRKGTTNRRNKGRSKKGAVKQSKA